MGRHHIISRIEERFDGSAADKAVWLALVDLMLRKGTIGSIRSIIGEGDFRVVSSSGQIIVGENGRPRSFFRASSQLKEKGVDLHVVIGLYRHAGLWVEPVQPLDYPAVVKWFASFENFYPEAKGASRAQIEAGMTTVQGWTDQTLSTLVREGKLNVVEGYYFLSRTAWQDAVLKGLLVVTAAALVGTHLFL